MRSGPAAWTLQQFREVQAEEHAYRFVIHDRDTIYSRQLDTGLRAMGVRGLRAPFQGPQANAVCEGLIGTMRREYLDFLIPLGRAHLRRVLKEWGRRSNRGHPHARLGPEIPDPPAGLLVPPIIDH